MEKISTVLQLFYLRLFKGETPLFFKYWGSALGLITAILVYLNGRLLTAPEWVQEKYGARLYTIDTIVGVLHIVTPFLTNKNKHIVKDNPTEAVQSYKESKIVGNQI